MGNDRERKLISRRKFLAATAAGASTLALAACGGERVGNEGADTPEVGSPTESDAVATGVAVNGAADTGAANVTTDANSQ